MLAYLQASLLVFFVEEIPGLLLAAWRLWVTNLPLFEDPGLALQFLLSAIGLGFQLCNTKDYLRLSDDHLKKESKLAKVVEKASTELDRFEGVRPEIITMALRLRTMLGGALQGMAREVAGDVMLLRYVGDATAAVGEGAALDDHNVVALAASVSMSLARREKVGATSVRERVLRNDMVSRRLPSFCEVVADPLIASRAGLPHGARCCRPSKGLAAQHAPRRPCT